MKNDDLKTKIRMLLLSNPQLDSCVFEMLAEAANHIGNLEELHTDQKSLSDLLHRACSAAGVLGGQSTEMLVPCIELLKKHNDEMMQKLHNSYTETLSKGAEPAQSDNTIRLLALSVERLTRQFEPIITSDRITGMDANALEVLEMARDMDWNDADEEKAEPTSAREWVIQALEYVSHCALGHDAGHMVHFANKAEAAMRNALGMLYVEKQQGGAS